MYFQYNRYDKSWSQIQKIYFIVNYVNYEQCKLLFLCTLYLCILQCLLDHQVFLVFFCHLGELLLLQILSSLENTHIITYTLWYSSATIIVLTNGQASTLKTTTKNKQKIDKKKNHPVKTHWNYPQKCWNAPQQACNERYIPFFSSAFSTSPTNLFINCKVSMNN